jgi:hypothetical protein
MQTRNLWFLSSSRSQLDIATLTLRHPALSGRDNMLPDNRQSRSELAVLAPVRWRGLGPVACLAHQALAALELSSGNGEGSRTPPVHG